MGYVKIILCAVLLSLSKTTYEQKKFNVSVKSTIIIRNIKYNKDTINPFNIVKNSNNDWLGRDTFNINPTKYENFLTEEYGIRAGIILLNNYERKYGLRTVDEIINRFCPEDNQTKARYIKFVKSRLSNVEKDNYKIELYRAILKQERGVDYSYETINSIIQKWKIKSY